MLPLPTTSIMEPDVPEPLMGPDVAVLSVIFVPVMGVFPLPTMFTPTAELFTTWPSVKVFPLLMTVSLAPLSSHTELGCQSLLWDAPVAGSPAAITKVLPVTFAPLDPLRIRFWAFLLVAGSSLKWIPFTVTFVPVTRSVPEKTTSLAAVTVTLSLSTTRLASVDSLMTVLLMVTVLSVAPAAALTASAKDSYPWPFAVKALVPAASVSAASVPVAACWLCSAAAVSASAGAGAAPPNASVRARPAVTAAGPDKILLRFMSFSLRSRQRC